MTPVMLERASDAPHHLFLELYETVIAVQSRQLPRMRHDNRRDTSDVTRPPKVTTSRLLTTEPSFWLSNLPSLSPPVLLSIRVGVAWSQAVGTILQLGLSWRTLPVQAPGDLQAFLLRMDPGVELPARGRRCVPLVNGRLPAASGAGSPAASPRVPAARSAGQRGLWTRVVTRWTSPIFTLYLHAHGTEWTFNKHFRERSPGRGGQREGRGKGEVMREGGAVPQIRRCSL